MSNDPSRQDERHISTDRERIREWADEHDAVPVRTRSAEGTERVRLVPESEVGTDHERLEWDAFHDEVQNEDYVVIYHGDADDQPFEVTSHDEALTRAQMDREELQERLLKGETVTSQIKETTVVESVVVEESTVESELVDTEVIDEEVVDVELLSRDAMNCTLVEEGDVEHGEWFDTDRYMESLGRTRRERGMTGSGGTRRDEGTETTTSTETAETTGSAGTEVETTGTEMTQTGVERDFPYHVELDVEEAWAVTRELTERFTVESRIEETDVTEAETIEDHDIDVEGLQRSIVEQGLLGPDHESTEVMAEYDVETEMHEGDRIHTHFERTRVVEDDVVDRMRAYADISSADVTQMEVAYEEDVATEMTDAGDVATETTDMAGTADAGDAEDVGTDVGRVTLSEADEGKHVVDASGNRLGRVDEIADDGQMMYVDKHSGITERITSALGWGDEDEHDAAIYAGQIADVTDDEIQLKEHEELGEHRQSPQSR